MLIKINTDNHIDWSAEASSELEAVIESVLGRFGSRLTRVEVHLSDENSRHKTHGDPMRCRLEARPASQQPVVVTADGSSLSQAVSAAARKMEKLLDSHFGKQDERRS